MPILRILKSARFVKPNTSSGGDVQFDVEWESDGADTLYLHFEANNFDISPDSFPIAKDAAGSDRLQCKITKLGTKAYCDVNFAFDMQNKLASIEVD